MRQTLVIANWKMNGSTLQNENFLNAFLPSVSDAEATIAICPPFPYLEQVKQRLSGSNILLGAQNVNTHESGAYTGETSATMLKDFECNYALVGHSERRVLFHETDDEIVRKCQVLKEYNITPVLCVGETLAQREHSQTKTVVLSQIESVVNVLGIDSFANIVIAYEPVWAIGTGMTASPHQAQEVHAFIRDYLASHNSNIAQQLPILYGGSVKASNANELFKQEDIDGGLVGGASLDPDTFASICMSDQ